MNYRTKWPFACGEARTSELPLPGLHLGSHFQGDEAASAARTGKPGAARSCLPGAAWGEGWRQRSRLLGTEGWDEGFPALDSEET